MALQQLIKLGIFLIIALVIFNLLKKQTFFKTEPGKISSDTVAVPKSSNATETQIQNEQIKAQMNRLTSHAPTPYISGCMKTPSGCNCYDAQSKPVKVTASICAQHVRDASGNQHKVFGSTHP